MHGTALLYDFLFCVIRFFQMLFLKKELEYLNHAIVIHNIVINIYYMVYTLKYHCLKTHTGIDYITLVILNQ